MSDVKDNGLKEIFVPSNGTVAQESIKSIMKQMEYINKALEMNEIISNSLNPSSIQAINSLFDKQKITFNELYQSNYYQSIDKVSKYAQHSNYMASFEISKQLLDGLDCITRCNQYFLKIESALAAYKSIVDQISSPFWLTIDRDSLLKLRNQWGKYGWSYILNFPCKYIKHFPNSQEDADACAMEFWKDPSFLLDELKEIDFSPCDWQSIQEFKYCYMNNQLKSCCMLLVSLIDSYMFNLKYKFPNSQLNRVNQKRISKIRDIVLNEYDEDGYFDVCIYLWLSNLFATLMTLFSPSDEFKAQMTCINRHYLQHGMSNRIVDRKDCIKLLLMFVNLKCYYSQLMNNKNL